MPEVEHKAAVTSVADLGNSIAHGGMVDRTCQRIADYHDSIQRVVERIAVVRGAA